MSQSRERQVLQGTDLSGLNVWYESSMDVSNPPTDAELTAAFGAVEDGFLGLLDDDGAGENVWVCARVGGTWRYAGPMGTAV